MRNIINTDETLSFLNSISLQKKLDNYPHLKKWLFSNARKYIINNEPLDENVELQNNPNIIEHMSRYGITAPIHFLKLDHTLKDKINHILDFLKSDYSEIKDVSRISFPQAIISAEQWLQKRLKKLSQEEDFINTKPFLDTLGLDGKTYTWVKINSKKGICREASIMRHCIESYWADHYGEQEVADNETPFYSLRDEDNKSVLTAYIKKENSICVIEEIKERFNNLLDFNHIPCVDSLAQYLINDNNISEVHITDESVSQWFSHQFMIKQSKTLSIIEFIKREEPPQIFLTQLFKTSISQNQFNLLREYFPAKKLYNSLNLSELSLDNTNHVSGVVYHAEKLKIKGLNNQEVSFFSNDVIFENNQNCLFNTIDINGRIQKNKFKFKQNLNCNVVLNSTNSTNDIFLAKCEQINFSTNDKGSVQNLNIRAILCDNISCDSSINTYSIKTLKIVLSHYF